MIGLHPVGAAPAARAGACRKGRHATWNGSGAPLAASRSGPGQRPVADASRVAALLGASRSFGRRGVRCFVLRPGETPEQARERRVKETERLMQRVIEISSAEQYESELQTNQLVVLEVDGTWDIVMDPNEPPPDYDWKLEKRAQEQRAMEGVMRIRHTLQRTARECPDAKFLRIDADTEGGRALAASLGIDVLPTLRFVRGGRTLWEHRGVLHLEQDLGEGVLYYGDTAGQGVHASDYVSELTSAAELRQFVDAQDPKVLTVVDVSLTSAAPCIHIYPAVLALARSFAGYATFGRLMGDRSEETKQLLRDLRITTVPTFLFYRAGQEVGRHVGSSRGDLIGQILQQQAALGIAPPPSPRAAQQRQAERRSNGRRGEAPLRR